MGFIVGVVSPIRKALIGDNAPLRVIYGTASLLGYASLEDVSRFIVELLLFFFFGNILCFPCLAVLREASIPCMTLIVGANLLKGNLCTHSKYSCLRHITQLFCVIIYTIEISF